MRKLTQGTARTKLLQIKFTVVSPLFLLACLLLPSPSRAGGPMEQVRATVDKVLTIVRNPKLRSEAQQKGLRAQLAQAIYPRFDFAEMAKRSLGPHWGPRSPEERQEFVRVFTAMLEKSYVDRIESYSSRNILYTREVEDANYAVVDTKIVTDNRENLSINYKLHSVAKEWKVYDLVIEDISVVNNYRSQFNRFIARFSFEDLVRMMKDKQ